MNWGAIIIFCVIVVLGESKKVYEAKITKYSCPTYCMVTHEHIQPFIQISQDSLRVGRKENK
jgi:hypothetical protein